jgi:hypothetical protein
MAKPQEHEYDSFSAPIPGESLTGQPGAQIWEQPPAYSSFEEAVDVTMEKLFAPKTMEKIVTMLDSGIPVEALGRTILFSGFMEGKFNPDVATLLAKNVYEALLTIGELGGVKNMKIDSGDSKDDSMEFNAEMDKLKLINSLSDSTTQSMADIEKVEEQTSGLMSMPTNKEEEI